MKQDYNRDPHLEVEQVRTNHLRRAVANIDAALSIIEDTVFKGPIRERHTIEHPFGHIIEQDEHARQQAVSALESTPVTEPVVDQSNVIDFAAARERMEAIARDSATLLADEAVDFMQLLNDAQTGQGQNNAA